MPDQIIYGENVVVQFKDLFNEGYFEFVCCTDCSIETVVETISTKTVGDGPWSRKKPQKISYTISLSGLIKLNDSEGNNTAFNVLSAQLGFVEVECRMIFSDPETSLVKILNGNIIVTQSTFASPASGFATSSFTLEGTGPYEMTDSFIGCIATMGDVSVGSSFLGTVIVSITDIPVDTVRIDYEFDGGGRLTTYPEGGNVNIVLSGVGSGDHVITFYAVCANGEDGETTTSEFTIEGECVYVAIPGSPDIDLPNAVVGELYDHTIPFTGDAPFTIDSASTPIWMVIEVDNNEIHFTGTPTETATDVTVQLQLSNCDGNALSIIDTTINVIESDAPAVFYDFALTGASGILSIKKNGVTQVVETTPDTGSVTVTGGDTILVTVVSTFGMRRFLQVRNDTSSSTLYYNVSLSSDLSYSFTIPGTDTYTITASVSNS